MIKSAPSRKTVLKALGIGALFFLFSLSASAQTVPLIAEGEGTYFEVTDGTDTLTFTSKEPLHVRFVYALDTTTIRLESLNIASSTEIVLTGLMPGHTYFLYENDYHDKRTFTTDSTGRGVFTQSLSNKNFLIIQPRESTYFIRDDITGGDCVSIGIWHSTTKTCVLTENLTQTIQIDADGVTLDGGGYMLSGPGSGMGVFLAGRKGVTIRNLTIKNFRDNIALVSSEGITIEGNTLTEGAFGVSADTASSTNITRNTFTALPFGIFLLYSNANILSQNVITNFHSNGGISLSRSNRNTIDKNRIENGPIGITLQLSLNNTIQNNTIRNSGYYAMNLQYSQNNEIFQNNFFASAIRHVNLFNSVSLFNRALPDGGNYWDTYDKPAEGCTDTNTDGFCDTPLVLDRYNSDFFPWTMQDGWGGTPDTSITLSYAEEDGYADDAESPGVHPNKGTASSTSITFKTVYTGATAPNAMNVLVGNGNASTSYSMIPDMASASTTLRDGIFTNGEQYIATQTFPKGKYQYYFEAQSGSGTLRLLETKILSFEIINTPVIIVPGILGSYLDRISDNEEVWVNANKLLLPFDIYLNELSLGGNGLPDLANPKLKTDGIIRNIDDQDFFSGLIAELESAGYQEGIDLFVFPYDWRLRNESNATALKLKVEDILQQTGAEKVDIVAHSMGGLVAKYYIKHFSNSPVRKFIDIATPHLGAPKSFKTLMYGDDLDIAPLGIHILNPERLKIVSQNMPSIHQLLPTQQYFDPTDPNYSYYFYDADDLDNNGITGRLTYSQTIDFLGSMGRNAILLGEVDAFHQDLDDWNGADYGVNTTNIVGCGVPTIGKIFALNKEVGGYEYALGYVDGDATVPLRSAESIGTNTTYYANGIEHSTMPSEESIKQVIASVLADGVIDTNQFTNISNDKTNCSFSGQALSFHSPIELHVYDDQGNHVGPTEDGDIENTIPGVQYDIVEGNKFVFLPNSQAYTIKTKATGTGTFNARIKTIENEEVTQTQYFNQIPLTTINTNARIDTAPNQIEFTIQIDQDGDGVFEEEIQPSATLDGNQSQDITKPETSISIEGTVGNNNWHLSDAQIILNTQDDNSGILKTEYSLDNGNTWNIYIAPFIISEEGEITILYKSTDNAGNIEVQKGQLIKIDKTAPEAKIYFDKDNFDLKVDGTDNLTEDPTVSAMEQVEQQDSEGDDKHYPNHSNEQKEEKQKAVYHIEDEAGNITELTFSELKEKGKEIKARLESIKYNNNLAEFPKNEVQYKWELNKDSGMIKKMEQKIKVEKLFELEAEFKDGITKIEVKEKHNKVQKVKLDGLVIVELSTNTGDLEYSY